MLELALDILFGNIIANIEASLAGTGVTFTTDVFTGLFVLVIFIKTFKSSRLSAMTCSERAFSSRVRRSRRSTCRGIAVCEK